MIDFKQPSTRYGAVLVLVAAIFPLVRAFGADVTEAQQAAVLEFVSAIIGLYAIFRRES